MNFTDFAAAYGLIITHLETGRWVRVPTEDHPRKQNGSYLFRGDHGFVQNHATMTDTVLWKDDRRLAPSRSDMAASRAEATRRREREQAAAARKAAGILKSADKATHPYLVRKGFPDARGAVWQGLLVVPMRIDQRLVGCQLIDEAGGKKFLRGQATRGATYVIDNHGPDILCEGLATGLSVRRAMQHLRQRYRIIVCFSAGNLAAASRADALIVADHDPAGLTAARGAARVWVGEPGADFNDHEQAHGTAAAAASLAEAFGLPPSERDTPGGCPDTRR